jgi:hypothetical protein
MPSAEGLIVNATNRPIAAISRLTIPPARECDLSREFFDVSRLSDVAISVYPKLLVFAGHQESGGNSAQERQSPLLLMLKRRSSRRLTTLREQR